MPTIEYTDKISGQAKFLGFYGLREQPFGVTPDPRFLYLTTSHREALASLVYGIETKRGFSALVAAPGMGKTSLLFYLLDKLKPYARTAFLFRPDGDTKELLQSLLLDLGIETLAQDVPQLHDKLNSVLLEALHAGKQFVWVIDEAQDLDDEVLESVRLLSNFETPASKLMHIVLAGQTALSDKLARPELLQLRQRVSTLARLEPLAPLEVSDYIQHRARVAGCKNEDLFVSEARALIAEASQGIPRNINNLCFSCLSLGFVEACPEIGPAIVREALLDYEFDPPDAKGTLRPSVSMPQVPFDLPISFSEPDPRPTLGYWWGRLGVLAFVVVPILLILLETNSRLDVLGALRVSAGEAIVGTLTGDNVHLPVPPEANPPSLQPPKPPMDLVAQENPEPSSVPPRYASVKPSARSNTGAARQNGRSHELERRATEAPSRVIYARGGENFISLAFDYYGALNPTIVAELRAHNPQIREAVPTLVPGQPVVLPNLSPRYPWRGSSAYASHSGSRF
jgi:general secretion pathway protein A